MSSKSKALPLLVTLLFLFALLSGCAPQATSAPAETEPTAAEEPAEAEAPAEVIELDVMHFYGEGVADQPRMLEWGQKFEAAHPEYKIKWTWGGSEAIKLFQARVNSNDVPDIFIFNDANVASFARLGIIEPLDEYLEGQNYEGDAVWKDTFYPGLLENGHIVDGKLGDHYYGIPDNMHFAGIFYNKGMFAENGYAVPKTWSEMLALCDKIMADLGIGCFGADNFNSYNALPHYFIMWRLMGAQKVYDTAMGKEGTSFDTPEFLQAAQMFQELTTKYYQEGWAGNQWPAGQVDWANNGQAMIFMPTWLPSELLTTKAEGFTMDLFPVPTIEGGYTGKPDLEVKFNGWILPVGSKHPDDVMVFIKFLTSRAYQQDRSNLASMPSVLQAVDLPADLAGFKEAFETANIVRFAGGLDADASEWQNKVFFPLDDQLAFGEITPEEFIQQLEEQTKAFYQK